MSGINRKKSVDRKGKYRKKLTEAALFIAVQVALCVFTLSLLIFYGPFENIKSTVVGMSVNSLSHQYIARFFLSDEQINRILSKTVAKDPTRDGEALQILKFGSNRTDRIELFDINGGIFSGKLMIIHDPKRVKVGYSSNIPESGETTSSIAKRNGAVAAINAGGFVDMTWVGTGGAPMGIIMHEGKLVWGNGTDVTTKQDVVAITEDGMLIVGSHSLNQLTEYGVKEAVTFGPPLVVNGKPTIENGDGGWGIGPRTVIGQRENGQIIFLVIDGRTLGSIGATLREVQDIMLKYGAVNAVNLDGGASTTMYFNRKLINTPSDSLGERAVPSVFMVLPEKGEGAG